MDINLGIEVIFSVSTINLSGIVAEIRSFLSFHDNSIHARTTQI